MLVPDKPFLKPAKYTEQALVTGILNGTWPPGTSLPGERALAQQLTVTRQTIREVLQSLAKDRWITIQHGKPTVVNDYWTDGGLGMLNTLVNYAEYLPPEFVTHLLQTRAVIMPACAETAVPGNLESFLAHLAGADKLDESPTAFAAFDWKLQSMMATLSGNLIYPLIFNDFEPVFKALGVSYFTLKEGRAASADYYARFNEAIGRRAAVAGIVRRAMEESLDIWKRSQPNKE